MIDIVIPTYGRADRIERVYRNIEATTTAPHLVWFVIEDDDVESRAAVEKIDRLAWITNEHARSYSGAMNTAYEWTENEWIFAGADDLEFTIGWDLALAEVRDDWFQVYGTNDLLNPYVVQGYHATHYLVRRAYLDVTGGVVDEGPGSFLHEGYGHNYTDTEFIATAKMRARFRPVLDSVVRHLHESAGLTPRDATHDKADATMGADSALYDSRRDLWFNISR